MKKLMLVVFASLISVSTFARSDMEAEAREMQRDRREAAERAAVVAQLVWLRDFLVSESSIDPTMQSALKGLKPDQIAKIKEANQALYMAKVGAQIRDTKQ